MKKIFLKIEEYLIVFIITAWIGIGIYGFSYGSDSGTSGGVDVFSAVLTIILGPIWAFSKAGIQNSLIAGLIGGAIGLILYLLPKSFITKDAGPQKQSKFLKYAFIAFFVLLIITLVYLVLNYYFKYF